jgi:hypothetical protein
VASNLSRDAPGRQGVRSQQSGVSIRTEFWLLISVLEKIFALRNTPVSTSLTLPPRSRVERSRNPTDGQFNDPQVPDCLGFSRDPRSPPTLVAGKMDASSFLHLNKLWRKFMSSFYQMAGFSASGTVKYLRVLMPTDR